MKSITGYLRRKRLEAKLEKPPVVYRQKVEGIEILFAVHNWVEYHNRARDSYTGEPDMVAWIKENLRAGDVLWDVGANVGAYTLFAAKLVLSAQIVAFEPCIPTYAHLWDNIVLNGCTDRIVPLCAALSDSTHVDALGISDPRAGSSEHVLGGKNFGLKQPSLALTGEDAVKLFGVRPPDLVKIDVDGYECTVLAGMKHIITTGSVRTMIVEVQRHKTEEPVTELLSSSGFDRVDRKSLDGSADVFNAVFVRRGKC